MCKRGRSAQLEARSGTVKKCEPSSLRAKRAVCSRSATKVRELAPRIEVTPFALVCPVRLAAPETVLYPAAVPGERRGILQEPVSTSLQVLTPIEARIVGALGQTMYPREGGIPIDATQARAIEYVDRWLLALPAGERVLVRLMFVFFEVAMPAFGPSRLRTFTLASPEARYEYLRGWEHSRFYFRRTSMVALRSVFALAYLGDDEVLRSIGFENGAETLARHRREDAQRGRAHPANTPGPDTRSPEAQGAEVTALHDAVEAVREVERARQRAAGDTK